MHETFIEVNGISVAVTADGLLWRMQWMAFRYCKEDGRSLWFDCLGQWVLIASNLTIGEAVLVATAFECGWDACKVRVGAVEALRQHFEGVNGD